MRSAAARAALQGWDRVSENGALLQELLPELRREAEAVPNDEMRWFRLGAARDVSGDVPGAMEAYERELIGPEDTGGVELRFGDPDAILAMIEKIAYRRDIGDVLAEGVREAARRIGNGAEDFAIHVKGLEIAYHDPRAFLSMAVNYATASRGGCHLESLSYWNGYGVHHPDLGYSETLSPHESNAEQARLAYDYQNFMSVYNPLGLCKFIA